MFLTVAQRQELQNALLHAFDVSSLEMLLVFNLDKRLDEIVIKSGSSFVQVVFKVITWAEEQGRLEEFVTAALAARPNNPELKAFAANWRSSLGAFQKSSQIKPQEPAAELNKPSANSQLQAGLNRPLRAFLCHSSGDKSAVRNLYQRLRRDGIEPWLDEMDLLPGQEWRRAILKAVRTSDTVIVCLSRTSITKAGYVQKEIKYALDVADEQPEDSIFIIPVRLDDCDVPDRLSRWQWVNLFDDEGYIKLLQTLQRRAKDLTQDP